MLDKYNKTTANGILKFIKKIKCNTLVVIKISIRSSINLITYFTR